ncbi:MAG: Gfo/Idh/MocA family oxidoreductase [Bacteroidales bacterium]|nr:Gfo/Idh/MocA family oxidoreductase [Bacteroidales bacterium]
MKERCNFAIIGAAGYIAPRHMKAIKEINCNLVAVLDKFDCLGVIDSYFPNADFFLEPERFDRYLYKRKSSEDRKIDFVSICSPNYLHDSHIRLALRNEANAICEKPIVLNPWNIDALKQIEIETGKKTYNILQLRYHPAIIKLREQISNGPKDKIYDIDLTYITSRGKWYFWSWKGDEAKSGGVATNIGIHFFDMLTWIFGEVKENIVHKSNIKEAAGFLQFEKARVRWFLSVDYESLPEKIKNEGQRTYRSLTIEGEEFEFSGGFTDLHNLSYQNILNGQGWGIDDAKPSVEIAYNIRNAEVVGLKGDYHPLLKG